MRNVEDPHERGKNKLLALLTSHLLSDAIGTSEPSEGVVPARPVAVLRVIVILRPRLCMVSLHGGERRKDCAAVRKSSRKSSVLGRLFERASGIIECGYPKR